jgi:transposase
VPARIVIDNAKCAITRACVRDPLVQRAYAECAEGYGFKIDPCPPHDPQDAYFSDRGRLFQSDRGRYFGVIVDGISD